MKIPEHDIYMETNRLAVLATTVIERAMKRADLSRSNLADGLGVPRSRVTKVLDGETNMTLKTLASFGLACGVRWQFVGVGVDDGTLALGWRGFELASAVPFCPAQAGTASFFPTPVEAHKGLPLLCSALDASQDPIGPLIVDSSVDHSPDLVLTSNEIN